MKVGNQRLRVARHETPQKPGNACAAGFYGMWRMVKEVFSLPLLVPKVQTLELFFFQRVFQQLLQVSEGRLEERNAEHWRKDYALVSPHRDPEAESEVPLVEFQRVMVRLLRLVRDEQPFDVRAYDTNGDGRVGWFEFCRVWKDRAILIKLSSAERVFLTLEDPDRSLLGRAVYVLLFLAIILSTGTFILGTLPDDEFQDFCLLSHEPNFDALCRPSPKHFLWQSDFVCVMFFTLEYCMRLVTSAFTRHELFHLDTDGLIDLLCSEEVVVTQSPLQRVQTFGLSTSNLVDVFSILPWYLEHIFANAKANGFIQVIRLTRVIRAFRLGRRFEAVIIIMRSLKRSLRAVYVLMLNLGLGMVIFGSLMYMAEQGTWDPERHEFLRVISSEWDDTEHVWKPVVEISPFESIPSCFWWAIVTATTVGYGDIYTPRTPNGKAVAGITMVWSLCVLALPIGVIGSHFENVWFDYDDEKREEEANKLREEASLLRSQAVSDPLFWGKRLLFEVWHDSGIQTKDGSQSEFLGEIHCPLDLDAREASRKYMRMPLLSNYQKARREVTGHLVFEYNWAPVVSNDPDAMLVGRLEITIARAEGVISIDGRWNSASDAYCVVMAHPRPPDESGTLPVWFVPRSRFVRGYPTESVRTTSICENTRDPFWNCTVSFAMCWTKTASDLGIKLGMKNHSKTEVDGLQRRTTRALGALSRTASETRGDVFAVLSATLEIVEEAPRPPDVFCDNELFRKQSSPLAGSRDLPQLQEEVGRLKEILPQLQGEVCCVRQDMKRILSALHTLKASGAFDGGGAAGLGGQAGVGGLVVAHEADT
mmetsp:Transcript_65965/g.214642  ORF Transcript_65965/g.214642 Transcript_65965/m.214642 type:complete len:820 (+) Transcript_65965:121-2580(+)